MTCWSSASRRLSTAPRRACPVRTPAAARRAVGARKRVSAFFDRGEPAHWQSCQWTSDIRTVAIEPGPKDGAAADNNVEDNTMARAVGIDLGTTNSVIAAV